MTYPQLQLEHKCLNCGGTYNRARGIEASRAYSEVMLLQWSADKVATIRDFRHPSYVTEGAEYLVSSAEQSPE
jgi:hypothetical protein